MKIATVGSCQAMALNWYIKQLRPDNEVKWSCTEIWHSWENDEFGNPDSRWGSQAHDNIWKVDECIDYIKSADYIIYQKILPETSEFFNYEKIDSYMKEGCRSISFSFIQNNSPEDMKGMQEREAALNLDIPVSEIILNHEKRNLFKFNYKGLHPNSIFFLEILRHICTKLDWEFFNPHQYSEISKLGFPFSR